MSCKFLALFFYDYALSWAWQRQSSSDGTRSILNPLMAANKAMVLTFLCQMAISSQSSTSYPTFLPYAVLLIPLRISYRGTKSSIITWLSKLAGLACASHPTQIWPARTSAIYFNLKSFKVILHSLAIRLADLAIFKEAILCYLFNNFCWKKEFSREESFFYDARIGESVGCYNQCHQLQIGKPLGMLAGICHWDYF